jgi:D-proline reductase (dithiol) PrdB
MIYGVSMVRLADVPEAERNVILGLALPTYDTNPAVAGPPLRERRVAVVSTAGLHRRNDRPFRPGDEDYRVIPGDTAASEIIMSHASPNFDRTGYQADINIALPIERLREMAADGEIGSVADLHYSFMGATEPEYMEATAHELARHLIADKVDAVLLVPI